MFPERYFAGTSREFGFGMPGCHPTGTSWCILLTVLGPAEFDHILFVLIQEVNSAGAVVKHVPLLLWLFDDSTN